MSNVAVNPKEFPAGSKARLHAQFCRSALAKGLQPRVYCEQELCICCERTLRIRLLWSVASGSPEEREAQVTYTFQAVASNTGLRGERLFLRVLQELKQQAAEAVQ